MTKKEYNDRAIAIQRKLAEDCAAEEQRHNRAIGDARAEFRKAVQDLQQEFNSTIDESVLADKRTIMRPI